MNSAKGLEMPPFSKEQFWDAIDQVVKTNTAWVHSAIVKLSKTKKKYILLKFIILI